MFESLPRVGFTRPRVWRGAGGIGEGAVMADLMFVFVQEDAPHTHAFADLFDAAGFSISDTADEDALKACKAAIIVWSYVAIHNRAFLKQAALATLTGKAVFAHLGGPMWSDLPADAPVIPLWHWDGVSAEDPALDQLLFAVDSRLVAAREPALELQPAYADAAFEDVEPASPRALLPGPEAPPTALPLDIDPWPEFGEPETYWADEAWSAPMPGEYIAPPRRRAAPPPAKRGRALAMAARACALALVFGAGALVGNLSFGRGDAVVAAEPPVVRVSVAAASTYRAEPAMLVPMPEPVASPLEPSGSLLRAPSLAGAPLEVAPQRALLPMPLQERPALLEMTSAD